MMFLMGGSRRLFTAMLYSHNMAISGPWSAGDLLIHL